MISSPRGEKSLEEEIASHIRRSGPISYARFLSLALHHPVKGYYASARETVGTSGDFITSPEVSAAFGGCLARQIVEMDARLGRGPFTLVEIGGGSGRLAEDILDAVAASGEDLPDRLTLILVESSPAMRQRQVERLEGHRGARRIVWADSVAGLGRQGKGIEGAVISNELFDALPVHAVVRKNGRLHEKLIGLSARAPSRLVEHLVEVEDPELLGYARRYGLAGEEGSQAEIGMCAVNLVRDIAGVIDRGFHLAVDYGYEAEEMASPLRSRGTMLAYWKHATNEDFLERIGEQDITSHVNFSALIDAGRAHGLETAGLTTQDRFLVAWDLAERIAGLAEATDPDSVRLRLALMSLIHPEGMGRTFRMLFQHKGVDGRGLTGLRDPYLRPGTEVPAESGGS